MLLDFSVAPSGIVSTNSDHTSISCFGLAAIRFSFYRSSLFEIFVKIIPSAFFHHLARNLSIWDSLRHRNCVNKILNQILSFTMKTIVLLLWNLWSAWMPLVTIATARTSFSCYYFFYAELMTDYICQRACM